MKPDEIKKIRKQLKLTQDEFGDLFGINKSAISRWESGDNSPSGPALIKLEELRDGKIIVHQLSDLEVKLLDQNVREGKFATRQAYLTASLMHLIEHGEFMSLSRPTQPSPSTESYQNPERRGMLLNEEAETVKNNRERS